MLKHSPFLPIAAQCVEVVRRAILVRYLALLSTWVGRVPERSWRRSLAAIARPPKSWVKTVGFTIVRVSDPGGQFSGSRGQLAFTGTSWVTATTSAMNDAGDAGDERT